MNHDHITQENASRAWVHLTEAASRARVVVWCVGHSRDVNAVAMMAHLEQGVEALGFKLTPIAPVPPDDGDSTAIDAREADHAQVVTPPDDHEPVKTGGLRVDAEAPALSDLLDRNGR